MAKVFLIWLFFLISCDEVVKSGDFFTDNLEGKEFEGYMGKYFLNDEDKFFHISINNCDGVCYFYIVEGDLQLQQNFMYMCDKIILQDNKKIIAECDMVKGLEPMGLVYLKIIKDKLLDEGKEQDIFYVSIGDNRECIEKYNSPLNFEKYCNPKLNKDVYYLKLYNLHPYNLLED